MSSIMTGDYTAWNSIPAHIETELLNLVFQRHTLASWADYLFSFSHGVWAQWCSGQLGFTQDEWHRWFVQNTHCWSRLVWTLFFLQISPWDLLNVIMQQRLPPSAL